VRSPIRRRFQFGEDGEHLGHGGPLGRRGLHRGVEGSEAIFGIALVQVPLCSFNAVSTVFVWAITSAGFSVWMKCLPSVL
jgi:hypothetical protein